MWASRRSHVGRTCIRRLNQGIYKRFLHDVTMARTLFYICYVYIYNFIHALHYIALHCITLHYITLHTITLHYIPLHYITLHYITYIHTYIHTSIHPYIHTSIHPYIHTSIHAYMHTCIHAYIHSLCFFLLLFLFKKLLVHKTDFFPTETTWHLTHAWRASTSTEAQALYALPLAVATSSSPLRARPVLKAIGWAGNDSAS